VIRVNRVSTPERDRYVREREREIATFETREIATFERERERERAGGRARHMHVGVAAPFLALVLRETVTLVGSMRVIRVIVGSMRVD
jgi:hypothetical protein